MFGWLRNFSGRLTDAIAGKAGFVSMRQLRRDKAGLRFLQKQFNLDPTFFQRFGVDTLSTPGGMRSPFNEHPWVFAVLASRARQMSQVPFVIAMRSPDGTTKELPRTDPLVKVFTRPNRIMTGEQMWALTNTWIDLLGEAFWILERKTIAQEPTRIWPWAGGRRWEVGRLGDDKFPIEWILTKPDGQRVRVPVEQIVHFHLPNPDNPLRGTPPLASAHVTLVADKLSEVYTEKFFENGAQPSGWIRYKEALDEDEFEAVRIRHEDSHRGAGKSHRIGVLDDGAEFIESKLTNRDMEFLSLREWARDVVCAIYGWPKWALGITDTMNFATAVAAKQTLWEENLIPMFRSKERTLDAQLFHFLRGGRVTGFFDETNVPAMQQVREAKIESLIKLQTAGLTLKSAGEWLEMDIPRQPGDTTVFKPINLVPIGDLMGEIEPPAPEPEPEPETEPEEEPAEETVPAPVYRFDAIIESEFAKEDAQDRVLERAMAEKIATLSTKAQRQSARVKRQQWRAWIQAVIRPSERQMMRRLMPYFAALTAEQQRLFNKAARENREIEGGTTRQITSPDQILFDRAEWDAKLKRVMRPIMQASLGLSETFTEGQLGPQSTVDLLDPAVQRFLEARVNLLDDINSRLQTSLARSLQVGINAGETIEELRSRVDTVLGTWTSPARSLRIARTEAGTLANTMRFQMGEADGDRWEWVTALDEQVRDSHTNAEFESEIEPVRIGEPFATFSPIMFPLDPVGPAGETVNCRCGTIFTPRSENPENSARAMTHTEFLAAFRAGMDQHTNRITAYLAGIEE